MAFEAFLAMLFDHLFFRGPLVPGVIAQSKAEFGWPGGVGIGHFDAGLYLVRFDPLLGCMAVTLNSWAASISVPV